MSGVRGAATDLGYAAGWRLVRAAPEPVVARLFDLGATRAARRGGGGARQLRRNLARVRAQASAAELDALVAEGLRSYARYWRETFRLPAIDKAELHRSCEETITGVAHLDAAMDAGRGALVVLPHSGNWDVAGVWGVRHLAELGHEPVLSTVAERLRPESLYRRFVSYRSSLGFDILPADGGRATVQALLARLRSGGLVCLIGDRDFTVAGVAVSFFGEPARMPGGPARLARATGAALLPVGSWFTPDGWGLRIHPPLPTQRPAEATQALADVFAADIAEHPADWHMLQPFWTADVEARHASVAAGR